MHDIFIIKSCMEGFFGEFSIVFNIVIKRSNMVNHHMDLCTCTGIKPSSPFLRSTIRKRMVVVAAAVVIGK